MLYQKGLNKGMQILVKDDIETFSFKPKLNNNYKSISPRLNRTDKSFTHIES